MEQCWHTTPYSQLRIDQLSINLKLKTKIKYANI